jgi:hypothetical protein
VNGYANFSKNKGTATVVGGLVGAAQSHQDNNQISQLVFYQHG